MKKKPYIRPEVKKIDLDYTISLRMQSQPGDPPPRGSTQPSKSSDPFASPFSDKPFG